MSRFEGSVIPLIISREFRTRVRSKVFKISTGIMVVAVIAVALISHLASGGTSRASVGLTPQTAGLAAPLASTGKALGLEITTQVVSDEASGEAQVKSGSLKALITGSPTAPTVVVKSSLSDTLSGAITTVARQHALDEQVTRLGGDPSQVNAAISSAHVDVRSLKPVPAQNKERILLGTLAGALIYIALMIYGQGVAQGVVEEKSSRVVELLLTTVRPAQLMVGKVIGIGAVGLLQVVLVVGAGLAAAIRTGAFTIPASAAVGMGGWVLGWFLLGFAIYALMFAAAGALVSRQEDVAGATSPMMIGIIAAYVIGVTVLPQNPHSPLAEGLSLVPLFSPMLMPMRIGMGVAPVWQIALSVVLSLLLIVALVGISSRVYRNSVLRMGARVRLVDAFRAA